MRPRNCLRRSTMTTSTTGGLAAKSISVRVLDAANVSLWVGCVFFNWHETGYRVEHGA